MRTPDDSPTLGEQMNRGLYLDPGFTEDKPGLVDALRDDIDDTTKRAQANLDQQRQNAHDVELIAKELEREAHRKALRSRKPRPRPNQSTRSNAAISSATLHACAIVPHGACGASPSKISPSVPIP